MHKNLKHLAATAALTLLAVAGSADLYAQGPGSIRGTVTDPSAALVPNANVTVSGGGITRAAKSDGGGKYAVVLPAGTYNIRADAPGFVTFTRANVVVSGGQPTNLDLELSISVETQQVSVEEQSAGAVSTDPSSNVGAIVMSGSDLDALSDDPDDLQADLQALAGPSAGPNGAQFFIDGFSGGQLPPKSSIREIRVNSNPFSSEFDHPGFGRVEILTRPGADKYHGSSFVNFGNKNLDSRNPFVAERPEYSTKMLEGNVGGPLNKRTSFQIEFSRRLISESALINAVVLDSAFNKVSAISAFATPNRVWSINPRIDYALTKNNTLALRYNHSDSSSIGGVGGTSLATQATKSYNKNNQIQATETAVLGTKAIVETRFQFRDNHNSNLPLSSSGLPQVSVGGAFSTGGAPFTSNYNLNKQYELQEVMTMTHGVHNVKAGGRLRQEGISNKSTSNFFGTYFFNSIDTYSEVQQRLALGQSIQTIQNAGFRPSQYTQRSGTPVQDVRQLDLSLFVQDDWRFRPNLTISTGLRYETQNNIHDHNDWAPRVALAWAPGAKAGKTSKTVLRAGWGMFYDRFSQGNVLNALRFNGYGQLNYQITDDPTKGIVVPASYPLAPPPSALAGALQQQAIFRIDQGLRAPYMMQTAFSMERALPARSSLSINFINTRGLHTQRQRNINAPGAPGLLTGAVPYPALGTLNLYETSGLYKQTQLMTNLSTRVNSHIQLQGFYSLSFVHSNVNGMPSNQYDTSLDWGRAGYDTRHRVYLSGTVGLPFKVSASPMIMMNSGSPLNITTGRDGNGDGIFNDRPSFATSASKNVYNTRFGAFNGTPLPGETIIPVNYAEGPGQFSVNVRLSRTWGFGERGGPAATGGGGGMGMGGGQHGPPGGGGGPQHGGGGFGAGMRGMGGTGGTGKKYNVTFSLNARNALNHTNLNQPTGNLISPQFAQSTNIGGGGMGGGPFGGGGGGAAGNRRVELQLRFQF